VLLLAGVILILLAFALHALTSPSMRLSREGLDDPPWYLVALYVAGLVAILLHGVIAL
jgi:hypothetical protein